MFFSPSLSMITRLAEVSSVLTHYIGSESYEDNEDIGSEIQELLSEAASSNPIKRWKTTARLFQIEQGLAEKSGPVLAQEDHGVFGKTKFLTRVRQTFNLPAWGATSIHDLSDAEIIQRVNEEGRYVADPVMAELIYRYEVRSEVFLESVRNLVGANPLRLSSAEGIRVYLSVLTKSEMSEELIAKLLQDGENDVRVVPMVLAVLTEHPELITSEHIEPMIRIFSSNKCWHRAKDVWAQLARRNPDVFPVVVDFTRG